MLKHLFILISFLCFVQNGRAQSLVDSIGNGIEKFDINQLQKKDLQKGVKYTEETENAVIEYYLTDKFYLVKTKIKSSPYSYERRYYIKELIETEAKYFHKLRLLRKVYDKSGKLIMDRDELKSANILLTIEELITIINDRYGVDLVNDGGGISIDSAPPSYVISIGLNQNEWRVITIDGKTGKTISDEIRYTTCGYPY